MSFPRLSAHFLQACHRRSRPRLVGGRRERAAAPQPEGLLGAPQGPFRLAARQQVAGILGELLETQRVDLVGPHDEAETTMVVDQQGRGDPACPVRFERLAERQMCESKVDGERGAASAPQMASVIASEPTRWSALTSSRASAASSRLPPTGRRSPPSSTSSVPRSRNRTPGGPVPQATCSRHRPDVLGHPIAGRGWCERAPARHVREITPGSSPVSRCDEAGPSLRLPDPVTVAAPAVDRDGGGARRSPRPGGWCGGVRTVADEIEPRPPPLPDRHAR